MNNPIKLFIIEGEDRDNRFVQSMERVFFTGKYESRVINLPASQNLYMIYQDLAEDDFDSDLVELLKDRVRVDDSILSGVTRQDIDEIYMFFDYDVHQDNLSEDKNPVDILQEMLTVFDNETENGKLYLSYPMVEALYDYRDNECQSFSSCFIPLNQIPKTKDCPGYKDSAGNNNPKSSLHFDTIEDWKSVLNVFTLKSACLFGIDKLEYSYYKSEITPYSIFNLEKKLKETRNLVFVLSAFPEFLFDYFKADFWHTMSSRKKLSYEVCQKEQLE